MDAQSRIRTFFNLSCPEKVWVITHPFVAPKVFRLTRIALDITADMKKDPSLDGEANGGQVDAFRHSYWMALMAQRIGPRKIRRLGIAHEKGNKISFYKERLEEGALPDSVSCVMDLANNEQGIEIGKCNKQLTREELREVIMREILAGKMKILLKDTKSNFLDCSGKVISLTDWKGKWGIPKCLVSSDTIRH